MHRPIRVVCRAEKLFAQKVFKSVNINKMVFKVSNY